MVSAQAQLHGNIGDDEIEYRFKIDTGHVENTTSPNRVSYSFQIPSPLLQQSYIIGNFNFDESYRVGNCSISHNSNKDTIKVEAVAKAVKHSSGLWYTKGGWLKGSGIVTLKKTESHPESRDGRNINSVGGDISNNSGIVNLGQITIQVDQV